MEYSTPILAKIIIGLLILATLVIIYNFIKKPAKKSNNRRVNSARTQRELIGRRLKK